jgi:GT2 family glycosyltransferase
MISEIGTADSRNGREHGLTVIVPTCNRRDLLDRLLASLEGEWQDLEEVLVVVNATTDDTLALLEHHSALRPKLRFLEREAPGKSGALNHAIGACRGEYLAFVDDDVVVRPGWAAGYLHAFRATQASALQGRILMPEAVQSDSELMVQVRRMRTHVVVDYGLACRSRHSLTGANMAVRRSTLERVGLFDERLGPGASGLCEDTDLAWRILAAGGTIQYVAQATVEHHFHSVRMTDAYFEEYFHRLGRSRWLMKGCPGTLRVLPNYLIARAREAWAAVYGTIDRRYLYRARRLHYTAMLRSSMGTNGVHYANGFADAPVQKAALTEKPVNGHAAKIAVNGNHAVNGAHSVNGSHGTNGHAVQGPHLVNGSHANGVARLRPDAAAGPEGGLAARIPPTAVVSDSRIVVTDGRIQALP